MLRKITKSAGRYEVGGTHDYPRGVWLKIANDLKMELDEFSREVDINQSLQSATRGPIHQRQRLGSPVRIPTRAMA